MIKSAVVSKGYELYNLIDKAQDHVLKVLFSGGVIRGKKLQRGSIYRFEDIIDKQAESAAKTTSDELLLGASELCSLFKSLFPAKEAAKQSTSSLFSSHGSNYWNRFESVEEPTLP